VVFPSQHPVRRYGAGAGSLAARIAAGTMHSQPRWNLPSRQVAQRQEIQPAGTAGSTFWLTGLQRKMRFYCTSLAQIARTAGRTQKSQKRREAGDRIDRLHSLVLAATIPIYSQP